MEDGQITDDYRIKKSLPTLQYLLDRGCKLVIISHLGRPEGPGDKSCTLGPVAGRLAELLERHVEFADDCVGKESREKIKNLDHGQILLLENLRYHPQEEKNDDEFAQKLAEGIDIFVQDGFGVVHRAMPARRLLRIICRALQGCL